MFGQHRDLSSQVWQSCKRLGEYSLLETAPYLVEKGICSQTELDRLAIDMAAIAADETVAVAQVAKPVIWARAV